MPVQSRNVLLHELYQGCSPCPVKGSAKSPRTFLVSSESKAIRFQRKDELLELFPGCHIRKRSKERRALRLALDHLSFTVGADVRPPLQRKPLSQVLWGQQPTRPPVPEQQADPQQKCSLCLWNFDVSKNPGSKIVIISKDNARIMSTEVVQIRD